MIYLLYIQQMEITMEELNNILISCGAANAETIYFSDCVVINEKLIHNIGFKPKAVCIGIIPYYTSYCDKERTVSAYALAYDYHNLIREIGEKSVGMAKSIFPHANFKFFGDHSPINEKDAAAKAGLGIIGENSLLITKEFSSYVFLFELLTDMECGKPANEISYCEKCGRCTKACPGYLAGKGDCLSAITQKKGELSHNEEEMIGNNGSVWGCDICQEVCPYTKAAIQQGTIYASLPWFTNNIISIPTNDTVENSDDFKKRAYSWRGKATILRNIQILNSKTEKSAEEEND